MGIYYFAVDYEEKIQMWSPSSYSDKKPGVFYPGHPLPCMIVMKNIQGYNFKIIDDCSSNESMDLKMLQKKFLKNL
jgi:hypothetical protein